jgi:hypothetical protein
VNSQQVALSPTVSEFEFASCGPIPDLPEKPSSFVDARAASDLLKNAKKAP